MEGELDISVVVTVFNSAQTLDGLFTAIAEVMGSLGLSYQALFVDDGSSDGSWEAIVQLKRRHGDRIRGLRLARNSGQQAATYCGLLEARGRWVVTLDDDRQPHPREIGKLWEHAQRHSADLIYGVYDRLHHGIMHRIGSRMFRVLMRRVAPRFPQGSSFRLIRGEVLRTLPRRPGPWILVDPVLAWQTSEVVAVAVEHAPREHGRSGYSLTALFAMAWTLLITYSGLPLRLMTGIGLLSSVVSLALGVFYLVRRFTVGAQLGFSALIVTITFSSGLILLSLGVLGEYVSRLHATSTGEPAFIVKAQV